ncbi:hypothetical protein NLJ89_g4736 [Agrocybe chaxingu]|uniref:Uncharacterized protein n=1 Tax=Agrocybe chaxingu TaxID=84603 RepID=A0A9W8MXT0_9AGAR|nr:hypothetical protein NLJ89_g4736 [Agrocybe chaxingu]
MTRTMRSSFHGRPLEVAQFEPAPPPPLPKPGPPLTVAPTSVWHYWQSDSRRPRYLIDSLVASLRRAHRTRIILEPPSESVNLSQYLQKVLLQPVADILNQMYMRNIRATALSIKGSSAEAPVVTFCANNALGVPERIENIPVVLYIPDDLFNNPDGPSPRLVIALEQVYAVKPSSPVIATNFNDIAIFGLSNAANERGYMRLSTDRTRTLLTLRTVTAAYLLRALFLGKYIMLPDDSGSDMDCLLPAGPPVNPAAPLVPDEEIFETYQHHSDFDLVTLKRDRKRALQFFRWKQHVRASQRKLIAAPEDFIQAASNGLDCVAPELAPCYQLDSSEIPPDTLAHLSAVRRPCPLSAAGLRKRFMRSSRFTLQILDVVAKGSSRGICTVYQCRLISIDGVQVSESPVLCLKLFDDRFQDLSPPEGEELEEQPSRWLSRLVLAEWHARQEHSAYKKLEKAHGSVFPWYYGAHHFTLPNGFQVYGILLEYVPAPSLDSDKIRNLPPSSRVQLVQSCRHAARVLDLADIAQHDWHSGQVLVHTKGDLTHGVLIDLASTTQTVDLQFPNWCQNFSGMLRALLYGIGKEGEDRRLVVENYGPPDPWVDSPTIIPMPPGESKMLRAPDPFPFIDPDPEEEEPIPPSLNIRFL